MLFSKFLLVLAATAVSALASTRRSVPSPLLGDFKTVDADLKQVTSAIKAWDGSFGGLVPFLNAEQKLDTDVNKTTTDLQSSSAFSCADSATIIAYFNQTLEPDLRVALAAIVARKTDFRKLGFNAELRRILNRLKTDFDALLAQLQKLVCSASKANAQAVTKKIDDDFTQTIQVITP